MTDSKYFATTKKGEIFELKAELTSDKKEKKKEAVKKVIASMTVGKDVSALFPDVVNCMQTDNLELKKLVYLYLMNYAKSQPDMAIMAVNTFVKDCEDTNPLIRALAVRTMGCIRVEKITEYLCEPLRRCLKDEDPYVRKTAAICVAKLYDINADLVKDQGFIDKLMELISDSNPMVVANAVAALAEINAEPEMTPSSVNKLLTALNECTEWGQVFILDSLSNYDPKDENEAQSICDRVTPRLSHANSAVVLSCIKVIMKLLEMLSNAEAVSSLVKKLAPPLVTLLSSEPEIQYVALRNINLIVQKRPAVLRNEMKVFFVKYNDPIYVKLEKLDIMIRLANQQNIGSVLSELKEYATEVDVDFVRKAVRAIGRCAIKVESAAEKCVQTLIELIQTKVNYVVQEAIVVIKDIFRKYPNKYEGIIATLCENLDSLDEPEARAAMIWVLGEYAERIDNADELLETFLDGFHDESTQVQLQLLTAIVKLFLKKPTETQDLVQNVLSLATQDSDNPDLRDRGYIYWRLLSTDPAAAKEVVLAEKPLISEETDLLEPTLLDELIAHIGSLASVYHKPPAAFIEGSEMRRIKPVNRPNVAASQDSDATLAEAGASTTAPAPQVIPSAYSTDLVDLLDLGGPTQPSVPAGGYGAAPAEDAAAMDMLSLGLDSLLTGPSTTGPSSLGSLPSSGGAPATASSGLDDLLGGGFGGGSTAGPASLGSSGMPPMGMPPTAAPTTGGLDDIFSLGTSAAPVGFNFHSPPKQEWLDAAKNKGLEIMGTFTVQSGVIYADMTFTNKAMQDYADFAIQFNKNSFGLVPAGPLNVTRLMPQQSLDVKLPIQKGGAIQKMDPLNNLQIAIKTNGVVFYMATQIPWNVYFSTEGSLDGRAYVEMWKGFNSASEMKKTLYLTSSQYDIKNKLAANNVFTAKEVNHEGVTVFYMSIKLINNIYVLMELKFNQDGSVGIAMNGSFPDVLKYVFEVIEAILSGGNY